EALLLPLETDCTALVLALLDALPQQAVATADAAASTPPTPIDAAAHALLARLDALLADDDAEAIELFRDQKPILQALLGTAYADVARALEQFRFPLALTALRTVSLAAGNPVAPLPDTFTKGNPP
ncbi:MAG: hypothetical protein ACRC2X_17560, partial [Giesbergeria sp.]